MRLTHLQYRVMNHIAHHEMNSSNGATPETHSDVNTWLWADEWASDLGLTGQQIGGVLASLENAGYIGMDKVRKTRHMQADESSCWFTEAGFAAWKLIHDEESK